MVAGRQVVRGLRRDRDGSSVRDREHGEPEERHLFTVGTLDPLLDDSLFLSMRWLAAGNDAELAIYPGAPHAFNSLPMPQSPHANARIDAFLERRLS